MKRIFTITMILLALTACTVPQPPGASDQGATAAPQAGIPNPASVFCTENGNKSEIRTAADGSQSGVCVFLDGNTCDEWDNFRGECSPATGMIATTQASGGGPGVGDNSGGNASGGFMPAGATEQITDWWGVIESTEPGAEYDDYFERQDLGQIIYFGITSVDPAVKSQIEELRDSGKIVHLYGSLLSNVPDYNGSQVKVDRIEVEG